MGLLVADRVYNLLESFENWTEFLDEGHGVSPCVHLRRHAGVGEFGEFGVDIIYLDYRKAFDTVPHKRLLTRSPAIAEGPRDAGVPVEIW